MSAQHNLTAVICSSRNAVTAYAAHFDLFCIEYSQDKGDNLIIVHLFVHIYNNMCIFIKSCSIVYVASVQITFVVRSDVSDNS